MKQVANAMPGERLEGTALSRTSRLLKRMKKNWALYLFVIPTILWYILFRYLPMPGVYMAFTRYKGIGDLFDAKFVGFKWFQSFFNSAYASQTVINTLRLSLYSMATFPLPIIFALIANEIRIEKFKKVTQTIIYAPHFISLVILVTMMELFFDAKGIVNNIITSMGGEKIYFLDSDATYPHMFVWSDVWSSLGWNTIIYSAALSSVDPGLHEAATLDGASRLQRVLHINLPTIAPTNIIQLILRVGSIMSVSTDKGILMKNMLNAGVAETVGTFVYQRGLLSGDFGYSTAVGLFLNVIELVMLLTVNYISRKVSETSMF
jgi:putative aldouronate transport system permease protein